MPYIYRIELTGEGTETTFKQYPGKESGLRLPFWLKSPIAKPRLALKPMPPRARDAAEAQIDMQDDVQFPINTPPSYLRTRETHIDVRFIDKQGHRAVPGKRTTQLRANLAREGDVVAPLMAGAGTNTAIGADGSRQRRQMTGPIAKKLARQKEVDLTFEIDAAMQLKSKHGDKPLTLSVEWDTAVYDPKVVLCSSERAGVGDAQNLFDDGPLHNGWLADAQDCRSTQWFVLDLGVEVRRLPLHAQRRAFREAGICMPSSGLLTALYPLAPCCPTTLHPPNHPISTGAPREYHVWALSCRGRRGRDSRGRRAAKGGLKGGAESGRARGGRGGGQRGRECEGRGEAGEGCCGDGVGAAACDVQLAAVTGQRWRRLGGGRGRE